MDDLLGHCPLPGHQVRNPPQPVPLAASPPVRTFHVSSRWPTRGTTQSRTGVPDGGGDGSDSQTRPSRSTRVCEELRSPVCMYRALAERTDDGSAELAMLWVLNQSDGKHSLLEIAERARMRFEWIANAAAMLAEAQLLERVGAHAPGRKTATSPPPGPVGSSF
jgi:winged helix-turn-helix